jgi:hypothetical protein
VQTCGIAGLKDWMGGSIDPGTHLVMNLYFTIDDSPVLGTYDLDTTRASWYSGGPVNAYIITVSSSSYITHVVQGSITITGVGISEERNDNTAYALHVYPTIARIGDHISIQKDGTEPIRVCVYDATGRIVARFIDDQTSWSYSTQGLQAGVYFVTAEQTGISGAQKIILY